MKFLVRNGLNLILARLEADYSKVRFEYIVIQKAIDCLHSINS